MNDWGAAADAFDPAEVPPGTVRRVAKRVGAAAGGEVFYPVITVAGTRPGPTACFVAGIHGDEYEGPRALWELMPRLDPARLLGRVVIVPVAHVAAYAAGLRIGPADGVNLARVFPGDPAGTITSRLAHDLFDTVVRRADFLIDLHSGGVRYAFLTPCCTDWRNWHSNFGFVSPDAIRIGIGVSWRGERSRSPI